MDNNDNTIDMDSLGGPEPGNTSELRRDGERLVGQVLSERYRLLSVLDHGGMGVIYRAQQILLDRIVAIKILHPSMANRADPEFLERFLLEASTAAKLKHENTVTIFDFGEFQPGGYFIAMELLEGESLGKVLKKTPVLSVSRVLDIMEKVCGSLGEAHEAGIIHRDVKPANIFLTTTPDGQENVKVLDFGLVKDVASEVSDLTQKGIMVGSPRYMSPEQIRSGNVDPRSDIYALGAVFYRCVTGQFLFDSKAHMSIVFAHVNDPPQPFAEVCPELNLSNALEFLVLRCLAKDPDHRFQTMEALATAIRKERERQKHPVLDTADISQTVSIFRPKETAPTANHPQKPRSLFWPIAAVGTLLLMMGVWLVTSGGPSHTEIPSNKQTLIDPGASTWGPSQPATQAALKEIGSLNSPVARIPLQVETVPPGARLRRDGADLGDSPLVIPIPVGAEWIISVDMPGYETRSITVLGGQTSITLRLKKDESPSGPLPVVDRPASSVVSEIDTSPLRTKAATDHTNQPSNEPEASDSIGDIRDPWKD